MKDWSARNHALRCILVIQQFPGAWEALIQSGLGKIHTFRELLFAAPSIGHDVIYIDEENNLCITDHETYTALWVPTQGEWVEWDQYCYERDHGLL
jgi:hypothetical protein